MLRLWPFLSWRIPFFRRHLELCPLCLRNLADIQEAKRATIAGDQLGGVKDFWTGFVADLEEAEPQPKVRLRLGWRWALGLAGLLAAAMIGVFILTSPRQGNDRFDSAVKLRINCVQVYEEPAQAFIFQTQDPNRTFVWVEKQN
jgi:hypothetical protein